LRPLGCAPAPGGGGGGRPIPQFPNSTIPNSPIYADSSEPAQIDFIHRAGFNIHPASKDVSGGISAIRTHKLFITEDSINLLKEIKSYKFREDKDGRPFDEPAKFLDHTLDALRYAVFTHLKKPTGKYNIR
jgi:phage terminase large subunit